MSMSPVAYLLSSLTLLMTSRAGTDQPNRAVIGSIALAVEQGSPVELLCRWRQDDMFMRWTYSDVMKKSNEFPIYTMPTRLKNPNFTAIDVKHNDQDRLSVLIINATSMDNAGDYGCLTLINGLLHQVTAELTVLTSPQCSSEDDAMNVTEIRCSVDFRGRRQPTMTWTTDGVPFDGIPSEEQLANTSDSTKTLTSALKLPRHQACGRRYSCDVFFNGTNREGGEGWIESNVWEYHFRWTSNYSAICEGDAVVKTERQTLILIGSIVSFIFLALLSLAIILRRLFFDKRDNMHVYEETHSVESENHLRNDNADYAELLDIEVGRELEPMVSNRPTIQLQRIERDGQVRLIAPNGNEYLEIIGQEDRDSPRPPEAAAYTPESTIDPNAYVIAYHNVSVDHCADRHPVIASYENVGITNS